MKNIALAILSVGLYAGAAYRLVTKDAWDWVAFLIAFIAAIAVFIV